MKNSFYKFVAHSGLLAAPLVASCVLFANRPASGQVLSDQPAATAAPETPAQRSKELAKLFSDIWEDRLRHEPEFASTIGDKRYNDQLTDYSPKAVNDRLARGRAFIERLSQIDTAGLPDQEQVLDGELEQHQRDLAERMKALSAVSSLTSVPAAL